MKFNFTFNRMYEFRYMMVFFLLILIQNSTYSQSTRTFARTISSEQNTDLSPLAADENLATRARVRASSGVLLGVGAYSGNIELQYPSTLPANTTSYIKIRTDENLLPSLLGGSLGGLLANVGGAVLIGNQEFTVEARDNNNLTVLRGDSQIAGNFASDRLRIVVDKVGDFYIAITPQSPYSKLRLSNRIGSLLGLFNTRNLDVYGAFYISDPNNCGYGSFTSFSGSGLNLDLLSLGGAGVTNPSFVIDSNPASFSRLSLGILSVAGSIEQTVYFDGLSTMNDQFNVRLKVDASLLALGVANGIEITAWNGPNEVQTVALNSLLNLDLLTILQGNQIATIPFSPNAPADRITVRYRSLLNVQLTQSLDLYDIIRTPKAPIIADAFTLNATICSGSSASLIATTTTGNELRWYTTAQGGTPVATLASGSPFVTGNLNATTVFYVAAAKIGCPEESSRIPARVTVINVPVASDINIPSNLTACQGNITLSPTSQIGGSQIKYYTDQNKTQEITTGYAGNQGVTYTKDAVTGALTISGLTAANSPYNFYISLTVNGLCENSANTLKVVTVTYSQILSLQVQGVISGCSSVNLRDAILNFDSSTTYTFFDAANNPITAEAASNITVGGNFFIQAQNNNAGCISERVPVAVTVNAIPNLSVTNNAIVTTVGNSVTLSATSTVPTIWYNSNGVALPSNIAGPFSTPGIYNFTVVAVNGTCSASQSVSVTVLDPAACPPLLERVYANSQTWGSNITGGVSNPQNAVDGNIRTFSTITTGIGLLGIGTTFQTLQFNQVVPAGKPVTIKLGSEYSGVTLAGGFSVIGTKRNTAGTPVAIGTLQAVSGSLLNLLPGQNTFEYTFVPSNNSGPQSYDGVRIVIGSLVSVAQNAKVFEAYYENPVTQIACQTSDAQDVLYGAVDLGIGVATATVGVDNPYDAIDASQTSYATMFSGAGVLAAAEMTVAFRTPSVSGDTIKIRVSRPGSILTANVLSGISIQPILNDALVGSSILNTSNLLNVQLLNGGQEALLIIQPQAGIFDKVRIRFGGVASVLDFIRIHDVSRAANTKVIGSDANNAITACQGQTITLEADPSACTSFIWYDALTGGNIISTGNSFTVPNNLAAGIYTYYIQPVRYGCEFLSRGAVTVTVTETAPETAIASVSINGGAATSICSLTGNVSLVATLNSTVTLTNPIFYWYSFDGTTQQLIPSQTGSTLTLTGLAPGTYTYYLGLSATEYCQTAIGDRTQITFTILPASTPADIQIADQTSCLGSTAIIAPTTTLTNPIFTYYLSNNLTQPILNGTVNGVTYAILPNGNLSITGLTQANSPYTFYVALSSDATCINQAANLQDVTITVGNPPTPTTLSTTQTFCVTNNPTVADLQFNETNVAIYDALLGGNLIAPTTPLIAGVYYATIIDGNCQSETRLAITVILGNPPTPTTNNANQSFCLLSNPTVGNLQVNQTNIAFYTVSTGGTALDLTTPLQSGIYYVSTIDGACESEIRLAINVTVDDPGTPTTNVANQDFCGALNPTVANIQVNQTNVIFYSVPTSGTPLALTTPLVSGTYYVSLIDPITSCQSAVRLEINVQITNVATPTTNSMNQNFCLTDNPTVASIQVNETNVSFFTTPTGGIALSVTEPLVPGIYYAELTEGTCPSNTRLAITITIGNPLTPTTSSATQNFCAASSPTVASLQVNQTNVVFYGVASGGTSLALTTPLVAGIYYVAASDGTCESSTRLAITVTISNPGTPTTNSATQNFCSALNPTVANLQVNQTNVVFYNVASGGTPLALTTPLVAGTYYASLVEAVTNCESVARLEITVTITTVGIPTTTNATQNFCQTANPTVASIQVNETNVSFFTTPTGGTALAATTPLTAGIYYAELSSGGCQSPTRLAITITIGNPSTPTTSNTTQNFCAANNPTVANLQVNQTNVVFYNVASGGTSLALTTPLVAGIYYVAASDGTCESSTRLAITVTISNPGTPTTNSATQNFCSALNPTVANLQVNQTNVVFYNVASGGTPLALTTPLVAGTYYASLVEAVTNCESVARLEIAVTITTVGIPTTTNATQNFCQTANPTVANIQVNETNVSFFTTPTGGTALATTTPLTAGIYYAELSSGGCQSPTRLALTITIGNPSTPTTSNATQNFCAANSPTVANLQVNQTNVVFYNVASGGTPLALTTPLVAGIYYVAASEGTCESNTRLAITVTISNPGTPTTNSATQNFCSALNPTVANLQVNQTNVVFYNVASGGVALAPSTPLVAGTYYASLMEAVTNCESVVRLEIAVTITTVGIPTTTNATQNFCQTANPTVASIQVNETNVSFFATPTGETALLTTTPLTAGIYYAELSNGGCQSPTRLAITITIGNPLTPTTSNATQNFCAANSPTVANLQVNQTNVVFYNVASGGTPLALTTPLVAGIYYVAASDGICESNTRLAITVTISNPGTPTTNSATQNFCTALNPTVANLQVNQTNVVFYNVASGGVALAPSTPLVTGTYYAGFVQSGTNCLSIVRLEITVTITNTGVPTTINTAQNFCSANNPTIANIQVNETNVSFFTTPTGGTALAATTPLTAGIYYAELSSGGCQSDTRLVIIVTISNPGTPTTSNSNQVFCSADNPVVSNIIVNQQNIAVYSVAIGGTALAPTTPLTSGTYYVSIVDGICESQIRLAITVRISNPITPTTNNANQTFCGSQNPTVANIQVNETGVVFYSTATGGTALSPTTPLATGTYYAALADGNCQSPTRLAISVLVQSGGEAPITGGSNIVCYSASVTYATTPGQTDYVWEVIGGTITAGGQTSDNTVTVSWNQIGSGSISVSYINSCSETIFGTQLITVNVCSDLTITKSVNNLTPSVDDNVIFTITVTNTGQSQFTDLIVNEQLPSGYQYVSSTATNGNYTVVSGVWTIPTLSIGEIATMTVTAKVMATGNYMNTASIITSTPVDSNTANNLAQAFVEPICLIVYNEFSPNNDGSNDFFRIDCIENYPNNTLQIHNRYGVEVYKTKGYQNNTWDGTSNVNSPINEDKKLPTGTYYYILDLGDGNGTKTGWIYLIR